MDNSAITEMAKEACKKCPVIEDAVRYMKRKLNKDKALVADILDMLIETTVRRYIYCERNTVRNNIKKCMDPRGAKVLKEIGPLCAASLLDMWVMDDGRLLGDWTAGDLRGKATDEENMAYGHSKNASFYRAITKGLPADETIRGQVTPEAAQKIWSKIWGASKTG